MVVSPIEPGVAASPIATGGGPHSASFGAVLAEVSTQPPAATDYLTSTLKPLTSALESVTGEARQIEQFAHAVELSGDSLSPGDAIMLSMQCSEFMFHCQLTATAANQASDGLQELFRQQG